MNATPRRNPNIPDRFISSRDTQNNSPRESLLLSRSPDRLSASERLVRSNSAGPDPFSASVPSPARRPRNTPPTSPTNNVLGAHRNSLSPWNRSISLGTVWQVGGSAALGDSVGGVSDGRGGLMASGTNAPLYSSNFLSRTDSSVELEIHERRLALALELDTAARTFQYGQSSPISSSPGVPTSISGLDSGNRSSGNSNSPGSSPPYGLRTWENNEWVKTGSTIVLDAPSLRDDYYCSLLAYSSTARCLAVGLGSHVYLWTEAQGSNTPESLRTSYTAHVTSLAFSSPQGDKAILAIGRADGRILLWSPLEPDSRFDSIQPSPICCVSFRPNTVKRASIRDPYLTVDTEQLLISDEVGHVYLYSVEWPSQNERELFGWPGALTLLARITSHTQQICGLAWSSDGEWFASGGNDNICYLYETRKILASAASNPSSNLSTFLFDGGANRHVISLNSSSYTLPSSIAKHKWMLQAAVKAIAFCPWQRGLIATGGGSNDRCIHFYHTVSGACLATIDCSAQVTSLIWSTTRREIAATFGFAQPEHPYRIAVFAWPSCKQIVAIPWYDEHRALYAIPYPGGPNFGRTRGEGGVWWSRTQEEGCVVVATSDCSIKFHEIWAEERKATASRGGLLGGSDILESLHGIDKDGIEVIH